MEKSDLTPAKAQRLAEEMFSNGLSYEEIKNMLIKRGYSETDAALTIDPIIRGVLSKKIRRNLIFLIVLVSALIVTLLLWYIGEQRNQEVADKMAMAGQGVQMSNGQVIVHGNFQNYDFLLRVVRWELIGLVAIVVRFIMLLGQRKKLRSNQPVV